MDAAANAYGVTPVIAVAEYVDVALPAVIAALE